jgi:hypothetical protein
MIAGDLVHGCASWFLHFIGPYLALRVHLLVVYLTQSDCICDFPTLNYEEPTRESYIAILAEKDVLLRRTSSILFQSQNRYC